MSFYFAVQISILNIIGSVFVDIPSLVSVIANKWLFGELTCILLGALVTIAISLRAVLMLALVLDRFCLVFMPYWYPWNRAKIMYSLLPIGYVISAIPSIPGGIMDCYAFSTAGWVCHWAESCHSECAMLSQIVGAVLWVPLHVIPFLLYALLFWKARKSRQRVPTTSDMAQDSQEAKKEWRATVTFSLLFLDSVLLSIVPGIVSTVANAVSVATDSNDSIWFLLRIVDAVFILRNRDIKDALAKLEWLPPFWYTCSCKDITCDPPERDQQGT